MRRLVWNRVSAGWRSGRYRIDLIAPGMWALVSEESTGSDPQQVTPHLVTTSASRRCLEHEAQRREWRRWRTHRLVWHSLGTVAALAGFALLPVLPPAWMVTAGIVATLVMLRSLAVMANIVTNGSWARLSQTYQ